MIGIRIQKLVCTHCHQGTFEDGYATNAQKHVIMDYSHRLVAAQQTHPSYEDEDQSPSFKSSPMTFSKGHDNDEHNEVKYEKLHMLLNDRI
jgi:hypothetical protein